MAVVIRHTIPMNFDRLFDYLDYEELTELERQFIAQAPVHSDPEPVPSDEDWLEQLPPATDLERIAQWAEPLTKKYEDISAAEWELSPLNWIREISSAHKRGRIGEELVIAWAKSEGLQVTTRRHRGHDCVVDGLKIEVKTSLRWNNDRFVFFGLHDFDYDAVALLAIEPHDARLWLVPKSIIWNHARPQLRGAEALGTKWLSFAAADPPPWLTAWGGSLTDALEALEGALTYSHLPAHQPCDDEAAWRELATDIDWLWQDDAPTACNLPAPHTAVTATDSPMIDTSQQNQQPRSDPHVHD